MRKNVLEDKLESSQKGSSPEMIPIEVAAPQLIAEDWVACDSCQKWQLLPAGLKPEQLPEKWLCSMIDWLPGMNSCDFSEDETTKAPYASYQMPVDEGQNNLQTQASETAFGVSSADQSLSGTLKKPKTEHVPYADKQPDPGMGLGKVVLNATNSLPTNYAELHLPEDDEDSLLVPVKTEGDQAEVSSGVRSLDVKNSQHSLISN